MPETAVVDAAIKTDAAGMPASKPETFDVSKYIGTDGTFKDGYVKEIVPEDLRSELVYSKFSDVKGMLKQVGVLNRMISKKGVVIPDPKTATPSDIDAFHRALGRPDTADGYKVELPDEFKDYYTPESIKGFKDIAFKSGLNPAQTTAIMNYKIELDKQAIAQQAQAAEQAKQGAEAALRDKWGANYETRLHLANYMVDKNTDGQNREAILQKIGNDPIVADFLASIAAKFVESGALRDVEMTNALTPADANAQMKEKIAEHQTHAKWKYDNPAGYKREEEEIDRLARIAAS